MKKLKIVLFLLLAVPIVFSLASCEGGGTGGQDEAVGQETADQSKGDTTVTKPIAEITMEDGGVIRLELDPGAAPVTVANFEKLVGEGFYDGLTFHRIIPGFMIQGGDPEGTGMGGSDENIKGEFASNGWENSIAHDKGVISMARSGDPDSASSQFFIMHEAAAHLDGKYAAFGHVIAGQDVVDKIAGTPTGANDKPLSPVVIKSIRIVEN
jgi:peptidyl-prolyl cis-trans isomerase B (cyclophilin B)